MEKKPNPNRAQRIPGKEKAAILMMILGIDDSSKITKHMNQSLVIDLVKEASRQTSISNEKVKIVLEEFLSKVSTVGSSAVSGKDFSNEIIKRTMGDDPFLSIDFLQRADPAQLLEIIRNEHPQVIAFVLSYMAPEQASQIIASLPRESQVDIAYRIATMETPSREVLSHLDKMLSNKLNLLASRSVETGGINSLVKILKGVGRNSERVILGALQSQHPLLAEEIKNQMFVFEDLILLDDRSIQKLLKEIDSKVLAMALKKTSQEIEDIMLRNLSERARENLLEDIRASGRVRLSEVELAQQEIVEAVRRLEERGELVLSREEEVYV